MAGADQSDFPGSPTRQQRHFNIAIICALSLETDAVKTLFDHHWDPTGQKYGKTEGDPNAYFTVANTPHNVVLAHMSGVGRDSAAELAAFCKQVSIY